MREPARQELATDYQRPNQDWICGLAEEGNGCPGGPGPRGNCPHAVACHPVQEGDRWRCNRSESRGGPCEEGPSPTGGCSHTYSCTPVHSMRLLRGRLVVGCLLLTLGVTVLLLSTSWRSEFLAPGELTEHHAQLVARSEEITDRCAGCHAAGPQSIWQWMGHASDASLAQPSQSKLCLECHKRELAEETALWAHNTKPEMLLAAHRQDPTKGEAHRWIDPALEYACSACHREHHGRDHSLVTMSDAACQACHREQYHSFSLDHPEFTNWPADRRTRIAFDHQAHQVKHYPEEKRGFACSECHQADPSGHFQGTLPYEQTCATCHDKKIQASWPTGLAFLSLPMLDTDALREAGVGLDDWPEAARGDFDGALPPVTKFLLLSDPRGVAALRGLGADFDFYDVDPANENQLKLAGEAIMALRALVDDLHEHGQQAIAARLTKILGRAPTQPELANVAAHLSAPELAGVAAWFQPAAADAEETPDPESVAAGGWLRDDETLALKYVPQGHADAWFPAWISLMAGTTAGEYGEITRTLLSDAMNPTAPGMCGSCHSVDQGEHGKLTVHWKAKSPADDANPFTFFNHASHVLQSELANCTTCHRIAENAQVMETYQSHDSQDFAAGFHALTKQDCTECHTPNAAGDSCTTCHRYHQLLPIVAE